MDSFLKCFRHKHLLPIVLQTFICSIKHQPQITCPGQSTSYCTNECPTTSGRLPCTRRYEQINRFSCIDHAPKGTCCDVWLCSACDVLLAVSKKLVTRLEIECECAVSNILVLARRKVMFLLLLKSVHEALLKGMGRTLSALHHWMDCIQ